MAKLDAEARQRGVEEDVVRLWKNNALPLRFWVSTRPSPARMFFNMS